MLDATGALAEVREEIVRWRPSRQTVDLAPALGRRGQDFQHVVPGDSICAGDDGRQVFVGRSGREGREAVEDAA